MEDKGKIVADGILDGTESITRIFTGDPFTAKGLTSGETGGVSMIVFVMC